MLHPHPRLCAQIGLDQRFARRRYGWSLSGDACSRTGIWHKGKLYSALGVFTVDGMIDCFVIEGPIDADIFFYAVFNHVLPHMRCFPRRNAVRMLDNCATHHFDAWIYLLQSVGSLVHFLPRLSPTLNPIEDAFKLTRMWSRSNYAQLAHYADVRYFIMCALLSVDAQGARHCIHNCSTFGGYPGYDDMLKVYDSGYRAPV